MFELTGTVSVIFSVLLSATIGWQASQRIFPFGLKGTGLDKSKKVRSLTKDSAVDLGASAAMNCMTIIWNCYIILSIWFDLGRFTLTAILYLMLVIIAFLLGWHHKALIEIIKRQKAEQKARRTADKDKNHKSMAPADLIVSKADKTANRTIEMPARESDDDEYDTVSKLSE